MINLDIIGTMYDLDTTDPENPISTPIAGYHVNTDQPITGAEQYQVVPVTPSRVFAGVDTLFYSFPDEATFKGFFPELYPVVPVIEGEVV
jgi:hypothetical protein